MHVPSICVMNAVESSRGTAELAPTAPVNCRLPGPIADNTYRNEQAGSAAPIDSAVAQRQAIVDYRSKTYFPIKDASKLRPAVLIREVRFDRRSKERIRAEKP